MLRVLTLSTLFPNAVQPTLGVFVDMGRYQAVAETLGIRWRGFPAWFLARTYHLMMMPGTRRRARLVTDWTVGLLFGRDSSELGQLGHPPQLAAGGWLADDCVLVVERGASEPAFSHPGLELLDERTYGAARVSFLQTLQTGAD